MAGRSGFEPRLPGPEPGVPPLNYCPSARARRAITTPRLGRQPQLMPASSTRARGCDNNLRAVGNDLSQLLKAETAEQEVRSVASQLKARFPVYRARLASFFQQRDQRSPSQATAPLRCRTRRQCRPGRGSGTECEAGKSVSLSPCCNPRRRPPTAVDTAPTLHNQHYCPGAAVVDDSPHL